MADLGDISVVKRFHFTRTPTARGQFAQADVAGTGATPFAIVQVANVRGRVATTVRADALGAWNAGGLDDGEYWASELGTFKAWSASVVGASVTVTPQTGGGGGSGGTRSYGWSE